MTHKSLAGLKCSVLSDCGVATGQLSEQLSFLRISPLGLRNFLPPSAKKSLRSGSVGGPNKIILKFQHYMAAKINLQERFHHGCSMDSCLQLTERTARCYSVQMAFKSFWRRDNVFSSSLGSSEKLFAFPFLSHSRPPRFIFTQEQ